MITSGAVIARNKLLAIVLLISGFLFNSNNLFAQDSETEFIKNFVTTIHYPDALKTACTPSFTNLLIDVSEKGLILKITLSDSAPRLLKEEFQNASGKLNTQLLEKIIAEKKLRNCGIIIPVFYVLDRITVLTHLRILILIII